MNKKIKVVFTFLVALMVFIPFVKVNALEYDSTQGQVVGLAVKEDGTITWQKTLDAYGIWVRHEGASYGTALKNANSVSGTNTVNLIELIEEKCISSAYGCPVVDGVPTKTGTFVVLIKEDVGTGTITNSEFTITYDGDKLSGTIVNVEPTIPTFTVTFNTDGGSTVASQTVKYGEKAVIPTNPTKEGYVFYNWKSTDGNIRGEVYKDLTFTAIWKRLYSVLDGADQTFDLKDDNDITIRFDGELDNINDIWICSKENDDECWFLEEDSLKKDVDFTLESGSVILTLKNSFLKALTVGEYSVGVSYTAGNGVEEGYGETNLTVKETSDANNTTTNNTTTTETTNNPQTGDNVMFYISMLGLSIIGFAVAGLFTRKKFSK